MEAMVKKIFPSLYYVANLGAVSKTSSKTGPRLQGHRLKKEHPKANSMRAFNRELLEEIYKIQQADDDGLLWSKKNYWGGYTSYGSWDQLHKFSTSFELLEKQLRKHVSQYAKKLNWDIHPQELECSTLWVNIMPQGATHSFHIHPLSVISGTYYVSVPTGAPGIQFEDPRHGFMMACPQRKASAPDEEKPHFTHKSKAGEVVLFESWMKHQVPPNQAQQPRVSVSFNYNWVRS